MAHRAVLTSFHPVDHRHQSCVADAMAKAERLCGERGLRLTPLRRRVLELIWERHEPVGAYELLDRLRDEKRGSAPPTVYRALDFLIEHGLAHRIESLNAFVGCGEAGGRNHSGQFLICRDCGKVGELDDPEIETLLTAKARRLGFAPVRQTIEIQGLCPACKPSPQTRGRSGPSP